jgi:hypothetical protein
VTLILRDLMLMLTKVPGLAKPLLGAGISDKVALPDY